MPFYQNPFFQEFKGTLVLGDRQANITYTCPGHSQRGHTEVISVFLNDVYDLTVNDSDGNPCDTLTIWFALDPDLRQFAEITVDISTTAVAPATTRAGEMVAAMNADGQFSAYFTAVLLHTKGQKPDSYIKIISKLPVERIKFFVVNTGAETITRFNARAGVAELPLYFSRHTVDSRFAFTDCACLLVELDPAGANVDAAVIDNAVDARGKSKGFDSSVVQADWELLGGKSGLFMFQKMCLDGSGNISQIIEYQAGAKVGDLARKICYYRGGGGLDANPTQITEEPYVLTISDLIEPNCTDCQPPS